MIRNTLKPFLKDKEVTHPLFTSRPEQLSVGEFIELTNFLDPIIE